MTIPCENLWRFGYRPKKRSVLPLRVWCYQNKLENADTTTCFDTCLKHLNYDNIMLPSSMGEVWKWRTRKLNFHLNFWNFFFKSTSKNTFLRRHILHFFINPINISEELWKNYTQPIRICIHNNFLMKELLDNLIIVTIECRVLSEKSIVVLAIISFCYQVKILIWTIENVTTISFDV